MERAGAGGLDLPGFRFHPTEEELLDFYLRRVVLHGRKLSFDVIGTLNIYLHDPCELPGLAKIGEREWYFFVPRDRRSGGGGRPNRTTEQGYWKATGSDRPIRSAAEPRRLLGLKKTLVFYRGRAPRGTRTDWVMSEYRLPEECSSTSAAAVPLKEDIVLCKVYRKATSLKELEQRAAKEENDMRGQEQYVCMADNASNYSDQDFDVKDMMFNEETHGDSKPAPSPSPSPPSSAALASPPELQIPKSGSEWMQDPFLRSPWMDCWSPLANVLNF